MPYLILFTMVISLQNNITILIDYAVEYTHNSWYVFLSSRSSNIWSDVSGLPVPFLSVFQDLILTLTQSVLGSRGSFLLSSLEIELFLIFTPVLVCLLPVLGMFVGN